MIVVLVLLVCAVPMIGYEIRATMRAARRDVGDSARGSS